MSVLIDISHPAHVHFFRPLAEALIADAVPVHIVARDKDVTVRLLEASGLPFEVLPMGRPGAGRLSAAAELVRRSWALRRQIRRHNVRVVLTRNPSGAIAAFGTKAISIFDTDDGRSVGVHYWAARPFANTITSSAFDPEQHGRRHCRYEALKAQMFVDYDPLIRVRSIFGPHESGRPVFVFRTSAHTASHDSRVNGINSELRLRIISILASQGTLIISAENRPPYLYSTNSDPALRSYFAPGDFLALLAAADLVVSDSGSVCAEAALLGTPSLVFGSFVSSRFYIRELQARGLLRAFSLDQDEAFVSAVERAAVDYRALQALHQTQLMDFQAETVSLRDWYLDLIRRAQDSDADERR